MGRKSNSKIWPTNSKIAIYKKDKDVVIYLTTDEKGSVKTNKRDYLGSKATVILGTADEYLDRIEVPEGVLVWTCDINSRGTLSAITHDGNTYKNEEVTVLVHIS